MPAEAYWPLLKFCVLSVVCGFVCGGILGYATIADAERQSDPVRYYRPPRLRGGVGGCGILILCAISIGLAWLHNQVAPFLGDLNTLFVGLACIVPGGIIGVVWCLGIRGYLPIGAALVRYFAALGDGDTGCAVLGILIYVASVGGGFLFWWIGDGFDPLGPNEHWLWARLWEPSPFHGMAILLWGFVASCLLVALVVLLPITIERIVRSITRLCSRETPTPTEDDKGPRESCDVYAREEQARSMGEKTNPVDGAQMLFVPSGEAILGTDRGFPWEAPVHRVHLPSFWIYKTTVTVGMFGKFVEDTGHTCRGAGFIGWISGGPSQDKWKAFSGEGMEDKPVICVGWADAMAYAQWAQGSLPSEAEWEKAAGWVQSSGTRYEYPWGNDFQPSRCNCEPPVNYRTGLPGLAEDGEVTVMVGSKTGQQHNAARGCSEDDARRFLEPSSSRPDGASPYGCLQMAGNVWEWTRSIFRGYPYNPDDGREDLGRPGKRIVRGGCWDSTPHSVTVWRRRENASLAGAVDIGFRVVVPARE